MAMDDQLGDIVAALPLPSMVVAPTERITAANAAAATLVGIEPLGRHFVTILRQPTLVEAVEGALSDGKPRAARYVITQDTVDLTYDVAIRTIGTARAVLLSFQDVTQMTQAGQMRRDFVANVSHELRTPLTSLMGFIETLRGPAQDDAAVRERFLSIMDSEARRMNRLVGDLLSLSRVESEVRQRPQTQIDVRAVLNAALRNLAPLASDNEVSLPVQLGVSPVTLLGDADQMLQVFTNLIENAVKYGGSGKSVDVSLEMHAHDAALRGPAVRVHISDQGPGIDPVHIPRLTERFYRADDHRSRALGGTGLGLAITKHILTRHRGRLKIASELGQGSVFTVVLPIEVER